MPIRKIRENIIIDGFVNNDGETSSWSIVIHPNMFDEDKCRIGLHWNKKEEPTHELECSIEYLNDLMKEIS